MKKTLLTLAIFFAICGAASAVYPEGYYSRMDGKSRENLKNAAKECVSQHTKLVYSQLPDYWQYSDVYPELVDGCKRWWEMYSNNIFLIHQGQSAISSFGACGMNREHSVPKSWWKKNGDVEYTPAYSDMWNLYPSDGQANMAKSNYPFGEVQNPTFNNGLTKVGTPKTGMGGGAGNVFEPGDEYKGDFARTIFYMATVYDDLPWKYTYMFQQNAYPTLRDWAVSMLLDWARRDPVSQKEIDRNDQVEYAQGNRNPFVDFPELAEFIWGSRTNEVFYVSEQGGNVTPPINGDPELLEPVNGEALDFAEVAVTQSISSPLTVRGKNLSAPLSVRIAGKDKEQFAVSENSIPAYRVCQEKGYLFNVIYSPKTEGRHEALLMLYDGGLPIGSNVAVKLIGEALPIPSLSTLSAYDATDICADSYTANWSSAPEVVDYYIVTRVKYTSEGPEAEKITAELNSVTVTERDVDTTETYSVQSSRLGFLSDPSNVVTVLANSGVVGVEADQPLAVGTIPGGFVVLLDTIHTNLRVYDMSGRQVAYLPEVNGGESIFLPKGIYLIKTDQSRRPLKLAIH